MALQILGKSSLNPIYVPLGALVVTLPSPKFNLAITTYLLPFINNVATEYALVNHPGDISGYLVAYNTDTWGNTDQTTALVNGMIAVNGNSSTDASNAAAMLAVNTPDQCREIMKPWWNPQILPQIVADINQLTQYLATLSDAQSFFNDMIGQMKPVWNGTAWTCPPLT